MSQCRNSRPEVFCKKGVLKNFANTQEITCARVSFLLKKRLWHRRFSVNYEKFLRAFFFNKTSQVAASGSGSRHFF